MDHIDLVTTFEIIYDENRHYDCNHCLTNLIKKTKNIQKARSCKEAKSDPVTFIKKKDYRIDYFSCVGNFYSNEAAYAIQLFQEYKDGKMPEKGGLFDQPAKLVDIFGFLYSLESKWQKEIAQRQKLKSAQKGTKTRK